MISFSQLTNRHLHYRFVSSVLLGSHKFVCFWLDAITLVLVVQHIFDIIFGDPFIWLQELVKLVFCFSVPVIHCRIERGKY